MLAMLIPLFNETKIAEAAGVWAMFLRAVAAVRNVYVHACMRREHERSEAGDVSMR